MTQLTILKSAKTLHAVADLLGFKASALSFILYKKPSASKYKQFDIPKRYGGTRQICAPSPDLKLLQRRLSELLQNCVEEINKANGLDDKISHGFKRKRSIITNLIGHVLDIHLLRLASRNGCTYSRYADDLTFSTNKTEFPSCIAKRTVGEEHQWSPGNDLARLVKKSGFEINPLKTRMQYRDSRQEVTGLVVNRKVNVRSEYRHTVRAMVHRLFTKGSFELVNRITDDKGAVALNKMAGTTNQLHGMLGFIDGVDLYNKKLIPKAKGSRDQA